MAGAQALAPIVSRIRGEFPRFGAAKQVGLSNLTVPLFPRAASHRRVSTPIYISADLPSAVQIIAISIAERFS